MKTAVLNFSGNVGKSTIAKHFLAPRDGAMLISVETINADEGGEKITAKQFDELQELLLDDASIVVDIGASNIERFIHEMTQYKHSHNDFDFFVVPAVKEKKSQADTIGTIKALAAIGVPAKKIRLLLNKVEVDDNVESEFAPLFAFAEQERMCLVRDGAVIYANDVFEKIKGLDVTISDLLKHETDFRPERAAATTEDEKERFTRLVLARRLAESAQENLNAAHKALFK